MIGPDAGLTAHDILRLHTLKARYFRFVDTKDWDGLRSLLADDLVVYRESSAVSNQEIVFRDADTFVAYVRRKLGEGRSIHHGYMPELERVDQRTASGVWAMSDWVEDPRSGRSFQGFGHYYELYESDGEDWHLKSMHLVRLRVEELTKGER